MKRLLSKRFFAGVAVAATIATLAACAPKPAPPPPPPPLVVIPPKPRPPLGAPANLTIPRLAPDGTRITVNSGISAEQALWNLRSAYNVAALNCQGPQHAAILTNYTQFLKTHAKALTATNKALDKHFKEVHGKTSIRERESYNTQVYNYFALPPVVPAFCSAALTMSTELAAVPAGQLEGYTAMGLARVDTPFREFFNSFDQYKADLAEWEARYGAPPPAVTPPALSVQQAVP